MRLSSIPLVLAGLVFDATTALAQSATEPPGEPAPAATAAQPDSAASSAPTPAQTAERSAPVEDYEPVPERAPVAATAATPEASSSSAGWTVIGIGGSIAAANIALGASLMVQGGHTESVLGSATLTSGITGLVVSVLVGALMM